MRLYGRRSAGNGTIPDGTVVNADLADMPALSIKARASNTSGVPGDLAAASNDQLLARTGNALAFQSLTNGMVPANTVGLDKLANASAQNRWIMRVTAGAGAWEEATAAQVKSGLVYTASEVANVAAGNIVATELQAAVNELDTEKAGLALSNTFTLSQTININGAALPSAPSGTVLALGGQNTTTTIFLIEAFGAPPAITGRRSQGTNGSPSAIGINQNMLTLNGAGYGASAYSGNRAQIGLNAQEGWTDSAQGTYIAFEATPNGSTSRAEVGRFSGGGGLSVGTTTPPGVGAIIANTFLRTGGFTVNTLPAAATAGAGARTYVTDSLAPVYLAALAAGGAAFSGALCTGAAWLSS